MGSYFVWILLGIAALVGVALTIVVPGLALVGIVVLVLAVVVGGAAALGSRRRNAPPDQGAADPPA